MDKTERVLISLPANLLDKIDAFCREEGFTRSEAIRQAMRYFMKANKAVK